MSIEFKVVTTELQNVINQLLVNRDKRTRKRDIADLLVSEAVATIRTTGSSVELPITGIAYGAARVPLMVLEQMADVAGTYEQPNIQITVSHGLVRVGTWKTRSSAIKETQLEEIPDFTIDLPVDASHLDTLGLASMLTKAQIADQGLTKRVKHARFKADSSIKSAASALVEWGVSADQIRHLVNESVKAAGARVARSLGNKEFQSLSDKAGGKNQPKLFD